jgi:two-component system phosphate regulon sensor histidine kinase PhoR
VRTNRAAEEAFQTRLAGADLAAGLRHPQLLNAVDSALNDGQSLAAEIVMPPPMNRNYSALVEPLGPQGQSGALIVLHDLTPVRMGERMRADFVANVSHELRTPLSSLLGRRCCGPARDDKEAQEKFLAIMHEQAERMSRLIEDLLSLSRIEMDEHTRPRGRVDVRHVLGNVKDMLSMKAAARRMRIELQFPDTTAPLPGDADQLTQVFQNLIDNALKWARGDGGRGHGQRPGRRRAVGQRERPGRGHRAGTPSALPNGSTGPRARSSAEGHRRTSSTATAATGREHAREGSRFTVTLPV